MAITDEALWHAEERLWLEGGDVFGELVAPDALFALPGSGLMHGAAAQAALADAPGWTAVDIAQPQLLRSAKDVIVIAYRASATRPDRSTYNAWCTSTYHAAGDGWRLIQHQQTPVT